MKRYFGISLACFSSLLLVAGVVLAKPATEQHVFTPVEEGYVDVVGSADGTPAVSKAAQDTIWIADWSFDPGCTNAFNNDSSAGQQVPGWFRSDLRILNSGIEYWHIRNSFDGALVDTLAAGAGDDVFITGNAAVLTNHDLCWGFPDGYGTSWYQAICMRYVGDSLLDFNVLVDSESGFDFLYVQTDSACAAQALVDYDVQPWAGSAGYRDDVEALSGQTTQHYVDVALDGYGTADTHCVYISFLEDGAFNQEDGNQPTANGAALVVDDIVLTGAYPLSEDFDGGGSGSFAEIQYLNLQDNEPFGMWDRVFQNISDNDVCSGNITCAWLSTDHTNPTIANVSAQAFAPNSFVMKNWRDTAVIGSWVSLASTSNAVGSVLSFRRFPGNFFNNSRGVQNWSVRSKTKIANTDTPGAGDSLDCVTAWSHSFQWNSLNVYSWQTNLFDMSSNVAVGAREIQMRFRQSDWRWIAGAGPPVPFQPAPGPFWDRIRIGRRVLTGPAMNEGIDNRYQAQDSAPKNGNETGPWPGPDYAQDPAGDILGTVSYSRGTDGGINGQTANLILGDSTTMIVTDVRGAGGIAAVTWYGTIVRGPHAGKAPPPYSVGANGFFAVPADTSYLGTLPSPGNWAADMDDTYFRGGDEVRYFWMGEDVQGGKSSWPSGMTADPVDLAGAEASTGGLFEFTALPAIDWDPAYLAAVAASGQGGEDVDPADFGPHTQKNCILYYNHINSRRNSGDANRTSFMQTLDQLGYKGEYDVYDHSGLGNTNNALGAHMTVAQARGYSLLVMDVGLRGPGTPIIPDGVDTDSKKIDMDTWLTSWLQAVGQGTSIPNHTFWIMGQDWAQEGAGVQLTAQAQVTFTAPNQATAANPISVAQASHVMLQGCSVNSPFVSYALDGGCPIIRSYDAISPLGTATETHTYDDNGVAPIAAPGTGKGAVVMSSDAAFGSNTIMMSHPWFDIRDFGAPTSPEPEERLLAQVLNCVLPLDCRRTPDDQVDVPGDDPTVAAPAKTALHQNVPNPFNPVTTIKFDLARDGHVSLNIYDVAGRLVRTLVNEKMTKGTGFEAKWNGLDNSGNRTSSGVYFYRLVTADFSQTNKMVLMK
jgi:hypothetical protein